MPKAVITGYKGFIGSHIYKHLEKDWDVFGLDSKDNVGTGVKGDCGREYNYPDKADVIFHCAADAAIPYCFSWCLLKTLLLPFPLLH